MLSRVIARPVVSALKTAARPASISPIARKAFASTGSRFLSTNAFEQKRATVQHPAPQWKAQSLVDGEFKELSSTDFKGKFLVMVFYPADFTFVCPTELLAFSDRIEEFRKLNAEVVGISVE
ncbi:hypothetical protein G6F43_006215 [Rhizopus delemar]|nr:hypothetical protein G6F43_006215 [Rhizopus delemar]